MSLFPSRQHVAKSIPAGQVLVLDDLTPTQTNYLKGWLTTTEPVSLRLQAPDPTSSPPTPIAPGTLVDEADLSDDWHDVMEPLEWAADETDSYLLELCPRRARLLVHNAGESAAVVTVETNLMTGGR